jgi:hypothetical protein
VSERLREEWNEALHSGREGRITLVGDKAIDRVAELEKALQRIATIGEGQRPNDPGGRCGHIANEVLSGERLL